MSVQDFFGKKLGGWVYSSLAHFSPIDLHASEVAGKISKSMNEGGVLSAASTIGASIHGAIKNRGKYKIGDWAQGKNIGEDTVSDSIRKTRMALRMGVPAALGASWVSGLVAPDNPIQTVVGTGTTLGLSAAAAGLMGRSMGWGAGAAVAGLTAYNAARPGDNMGPF